MGIWEVIITTPPYIRGFFAAGVTYVLMEMFKPGFAFSSISPGQYMPRAFREDQMLNDDEEAIVSGTNFTWWSVPLLVFVIFSLFI